MASQLKPSVAVAIPTLGREEVLVDTVRSLLALADPPDQILVVDQTPKHECTTRQQLEAFSKGGQIEWIRRSRPSIPGAMNAALGASSADVVIFVDDDVVPGAVLVAAHREAHAGSDRVLIAGQVLQTGEEPGDLVGEQFRFRSRVPQDVSEFMGGNFSVKRRHAIELGGFDECFVGAAYRFEADFAARWLEQSGRIRFEPGASIRHLRAARGGTRTYGSHETTPGPSHAVGEYYFLLRNRPSGFVRRFFSRPVLAIATRHHLRKPWWVPVTLFAEVSGMAWAIALALGPRRLVRVASGGRERS